MGCWFIASKFLALGVFILMNVTSTVSKSSKSSKSSSKENFKGSKLGTRAYNKELEVIELAKADYLIASQAESYFKRKLLLCVVFMRPSATTLVTRNLARLGKSCEWAFVFYDGTDQEINKFCNDSSVQTVVYCKLASQALANKKSLEISRRAIPKSVLYRELLPYTSAYQRIFLMDEDISLLDFNSDKFLQIWDCSLPHQPPPLIVQPVIAEPTQYFNFVWQKTWQHTGYVAIASGLVEQQVPFFDAIFFEWFVKRVLVATKDVATKYGVDWGHDRSWCNAAKMYSTQVLGWGSKSHPCAILVGAPPVHHMNTHAMQNKKKDVSGFRENGNKVVQHYIDLYPTWVLTDITRSTNPTDKVHGKKYARVRKLNTTCVRIRGGDNLFMLRQTVSISKSQRNSSVAGSTIMPTTTVITQLLPPKEGNLTMTIKS